jgi:hypothetical protein
LLVILVRVLGDKIDAITYSSTSKTRKASDHERIGAVSIPIRDLYVAFVTTDVSTC